jgi:hypothetical protein
VKAGDAGQRLKVSKGTRMAKEIEKAGKPPKKGK